MTVLKPVFDADGEKLAQRMTRAAQSNPEWFKEYVREYAKSGEDLPYHPNLGLSEPEYARLLELTKQLQLEPDGEATIVVTRDPNSADGVIVEGGPQLPFLRGLRIDFQTLTVATPIGSCAAPEVETAAAGHTWKNLGRYEAYRWSCSQGDDLDTPEGVWSVKLTLGQLIDRGEGIFYFKAQAGRDGAVTHDTCLILTFPLGEGQPGLGPTTRSRAANER